MYRYDELTKLTSEKVRYIIVLAVGKKILNNFNYSEKLTLPLRTFRETSFGLLKTFFPFCRSAN
jgi:hypothetical protein